MVEAISMGEKFISRSYKILFGLCAAVPILGTILTFRSLLEAQKIHTGLEGLVIPLVFAVMFIFFAVIPSGVMTLIGVIILFAMKRAGISRRYYMWTTLVTALPLIVFVIFIIYSFFQSYVDATLYIH
ncbi:MAG: hypothetical protein G01um10148_840 [Parcubacteria group bacterium Gr01-1014_8]|nr:MAG: hypothetical protein G01um10148_840 [Parcubacteria group bacterium Gr01-1014_8]